MDVGERWGYRQKVWTLGEPLRPVEVVKFGPKLSNKVRIRWLDGEFEDLEEWVPRVRLVVHWEHIENFVLDERQELAFIATQPEPPEPAVAKAVENIWFASRQEIVDFDVQRRRPLRASIEDFEEVRGRLPLPATEVGPAEGAYVDSCGTLHVGQDMAVKLAQAYCRTESMTILAYGADEVERIKTASISGWYMPSDDDEPRRVDKDRVREWLIEVEATWAIVREWCGVPALEAFDELTVLRAEVERLHLLLERTTDWIKDAGHHVKAAQLRRELR